MLGTMDDDLLGIAASGPSGLPRHAQLRDPSGNHIGLYQS